MCIADQEYITSLELRLAAAEAEIKRLREESVKLKKDSTNSHKSESDCWPSAGCARSGSWRG